MIHSVVQIPGPGCYVQTDPTHMLPCCSLDISPTFIFYLWPDDTRFEHILNEGSDQLRTLARSIFSHLSQRRAAPQRQLLDTLPYQARNSCILYRHRHRQYFSDILTGRLLLLCPISMSSSPKILSPRSLHLTKPARHHSFPKNSVSEPDAS